MQGIGPHAVTNAGNLLRVFVWDVFAVQKHPTQTPARSLLVPYANVLPNVSLSIFHSKKETCGRLARLVNDIRYGSFITVGLPGKLPKASGLRPIFFQQKREKIKDTTLLKWSEIRKLGARQDLLWSSFLTMSFFSKRGKKTC